MDGRMAKWCKALRSVGKASGLNPGKNKKFSSFDEYFYFQGVPLTPPPPLTPKCQNGKISF